MSKPRPKFCVGEEVIICGKHSTNHNGVRVEILRMEYSFSGDPERDPSTHGMGWSYKTEVGVYDGWWAESALRKIPPKDRSDWEDCVWSPVKEKAPAGTEA